MNLRVIEGVFFTLKIAAGITERFIQPQRIEIISDIIMRSHLFFLVLLGTGGEYQLFQFVLIG